MSDETKALLRDLESAYTKAVNAKRHALAESIADMIKCIKD